ncbi:WASP homolog-associated protein with actin, membranes and microtubules isoform X2 [Entelurus aequoreus]|uniref:WASP homolog-associated protein with actin, membranes and microtubules isoform X2 n=1 Tax=Entelurus aequoreus TaxID=161455 RepID=UPI002B1E6F04|nr:WASP homolog-associated protein with actin, membranes and microtubules isoform X2 [Entelurus aequoreus]
MAAVVKTAASQVFPAMNDADCERPDSLEGWVAVKSNIFEDAEAFKLGFIVQWNVIESKFAVTCHNRTLQRRQKGKEDKDKDVTTTTTTSWAALLSVSDLKLIHHQLTGVGDVLASCFPDLSHLKAANIWDVLASASTLDEQEVDVCCRKLEKYFAAAIDVCGTEIVLDTLFCQDARDVEDYFDNMHEFKSKTLHDHMSRVKGHLRQLLQSHSSADNMMVLLVIYQQEDQVYQDLVTVATTFFQYLLQPFRDMRELACLYKMDILKSLDLEDLGPKRIEALEKEAQEWKTKAKDAESSIQDLTVTYFAQTSKSLQGMVKQMEEDKCRFGVSAWASAAPRLENLHLLLAKEGLQHMRATEMCLSRKKEAIRKELASLCASLQQQAAEGSPASHGDQQQVAEGSPASHGDQQQTAEGSPASHGDQQQVAEGSPASHGDQQQTAEGSPASHGDQQQVAEGSPASHGDQQQAAEGSPASHGDQQQTAEGSPASHGDQQQVAEGSPASHGDQQQTAEGSPASHGDQQQTAVDKLELLFYETQLEVYNTKFEILKKEEQLLVAQRDTLRRQIRELKEEVVYYDVCEDPEELQSMIPQQTEPPAVAQLRRRVQTLETKRGHTCARRAYLRNKKEQCVDAHEQKQRAANTTSVLFTRHHHVHMKREKRKEEEQRRKQFVDQEREKTLSRLKSFREKRAGQHVLKTPQSRTSRPSQPLSIISPGPPPSSRPPVQTQPRHIPPAPGHTCTLPAFVPPPPPPPPPPPVSTSCEDTPMALRDTPPPPPPPPPAKRTLTQNIGSMDEVLASLQRGQIQLRKTKTSMKSPADPRTSLMSSIRQGVTLKKMIPAGCKVLTSNTDNELERSIKAAMLRMKKVSADSDQEDEHTHSEDWDS